MIRALLAAATLVTPDCQPLCLGVCHYDWRLGYCYDTRVARLGIWDVVPWGYIPPEERDFPGWVVPYPKQYGEYPMEQHAPEVEAVHETGERWVP